MNNINEQGSIPFNIVSGQLLQNDHHIPPEQISAHQIGISQQQIAHQPVQRAGNPQNQQTHIQPQRNLQNQFSFPQMSTLGPPSHVSNASPPVGYKASFSQNRMANRAAIQVQGSKSNPATPILSSNSRFHASHPNPRQATRVNSAGSAHVPVVYPQELSQTNPVARIPSQQNIPTSASQSQIHNLNSAASSTSPMVNQRLQNDMNIKIFKRNLGNTAMLRLISIFDQISAESNVELAKLDYWKRILHMHCSPNFTLKIIPTNDNQSPQLRSGNRFDLHTEHGEMGKGFSVPHHTCPTFLVSLFQDSCISKIETHFSMLKFQILGNGQVLTVCKFTVHTTFLDGTRSCVTGNTRVIFNRDFKIDWMDWHYTNIEFFFGLGTLENALQHHGDSRRNFGGNSSTTKPQAQNSKKGFVKSEFGPEGFDDYNGPTNFIHSVYSSSQALANSGTTGIRPNAMRTLEMVDIMGKLKPLMNYTKQKNLTSPLDALEKMIRVDNTSDNLHGDPKNASVPSFNQYDDRASFKKMRLGGQNM